MTETATSQSAQPTPLAKFLAAGAGSPVLVPYRGALTPQQLDAPEKEIEAFLSGAALHDMGWQSRVILHGEDRFRWLSGMVTNMVKDLPENGGAWNLVLNAQGRILGDLTVWRDIESLELELATDQREKLLAHLEHFIIMDDVELVPVAGETAIGLAGPRADETLERLCLPTLPEPMTGAKAGWEGLNLCVYRTFGVFAPRYTLWVRATEVEKLWQALAAVGAAPVGSASLDKLRLAEGIPAYGIDIAERDLPQETSQTKALHFNKGCYLGQEIVERIHSRGNVHRHLRQLELAGRVPEPGAELTLEDGSAAGQITSAAELQLPSGNRVFALGMILAAAELKKQPLNYNSGTARILASPPLLGPEQG